MVYKGDKSNSSDHFSRTLCGTQRDACLTANVRCHEGLQNDGLKMTLKKEIKKHSQQSPPKRMQGTS